MMATFMLMLWPRAEVSAERITEVLETEPSVVAPADAVQVTLDRGHIDIRGASFAFPGAEQDVLHEHRPGRQAGRDHGDHRLDRQRQVDAARA